MPLPRTTKTRNQRADSWQQLAAIRISVAGYGDISVADLVQQASVADPDPPARKRLSLELGNLATLLESLPLAARDEIVERITDIIRETYERAD
jgi:hypothetical protein